MDISKASNFERFIFDLLEGDSKRVKALFDQIEVKGYFDLSGGAGSDGNEFHKVSNFGFVSGKSTHEDRIQTIRDVYEAYDLVIDTHTADGVKVAMSYIEPNIPMIVLETAQATKFNEIILEALGIDAWRPKGFENLEKLSQRYVVMQADPEKVKQYLAENTGA
jgi:threonine synthase